MLVLRILFITAAVGLLAVVLPRGQRLAPQPLDFNHRLHLERVQGVRCENCHLFANSRHFAGVPSKRLCFGCHEPEGEGADTDAKKPAFAELMSFADTEGDIPWRRVTASHEDVFFSHRRHVKVAEIDCRRCHPDIPDRTSPPTEGLIEMSMDTCIECHRESNASVDCIACHR